MPGYTLFDTALGCCGVVWTEHAICGVQLPEPSPDETRRRLLRSFPAAVARIPPPAVDAVLGRIAALLRGTPDDLRDIDVDLGSMAAFPRRVYEFIRTIPPGSVMTYGEVAAAVGEPGGAQAVGQAMGRNPVPIIVPCHRVVAAGGRLGGFSANGGAQTKRRILTIEGADRPDTQPALFE